MSIIVEVLEGGDVALIRLSRPEKLNAITRDMWERLASEVNRLCSEAKALVFTGSGRAFSAGDDIGEMYSLESPSDARGFFSALASAVEAIVKCRRPLVAAVNGLAVGGGGEILLLMDYVVASKSAWISFPESRIGLIPPLLLTLGSMQLGPRLARSLALSGRRLAAEEALYLGLADEVVDGDPLPRAVEVAKDMAGLPEDVVALIKLQTLRGFEDALRLVAELERLVLTGEAKGRMRAFLEKRLR